MGIDPKQIEYLQLARGEENLGEQAFRQTGENIRSVRTDFALVDQWKQIRWTRDDSCALPELEIGKSGMIS